jgi:hypothetical protein
VTPLPTTKKWYQRLPADWNFRGSPNKACGRKPFGTLGSGSHFLEVSRVERSASRALLSLEVGQMRLLIHSGSRRLLSSANHSDSSGLARSLALSFSRVAAARRIPVLPDVLQRNSAARARHARANDRKIRPSGRACHYLVQDSIMPTTRAKIVHGRRFAYCSIQHSLWTAGIPCRR